MTTKSKPLAPGDTVYHVTGSAEKKPGIVIATGLVEVDWGPDSGDAVHHPGSLTTTFTPDYGTRDE